MRPSAQRSATSSGSPPWNWPRRGAAWKPPCEKAPDYADAWALLALLSAQESGAGLQPSGGLSRQRGERCTPSRGSRPLESSGVYQPGPGALLSEGIPDLRNLALRSVVLNPMDGNSLAYMGELLTCSGDWEQGLALSARAKALNPHHPVGTGSPISSMPTSSATIAARSISCSRATCRDIGARTWRRLPSTASSGTSTRLARRSDACSSCARTSPQRLGRSSPNGGIRPCRSRD